MKSNQVTRKKFLINSGIFLTMPMLLQYCSSVYPRLKGKNGLDPLENANEIGLDSPILKSINVGITAPNPHNTQAWKFKIINSTEMNLYIDETRILKITDPTTRQIHIGQGTFLELFKIGAEQIGYKTDIKILPEGENKISDISKKPIAKIKLTPNKNSNHPLYDSIKSRTTNRAVYEGDMITNEEIEKLKVLGKPENSDIISILNQSEMKPYLEIFFEAMKLESTTYRTNDESRIWFRFSDDEIQTKRDGIALPDQGVTGLTRFFAETFFLGKEPKKFHDKTGIDIFLSRYKKKIDSSKGIVFWKTKSNTQKDWILTGMDYARFQLSATKEGLVMHPFSQALQEFEEMNIYRNQLDEITKTKEGEKIQMIVRLGRADYKYFTPRRSIRDMII